MPNVFRDTRCCQPEIYPPHDKLPALADRHTSEIKHLYFICFFATTEAHPVKIDHI